MRLSISQLKSSENGNGSAGVLLICGGVLLLWFVFMTMTNFIGGRQQAKRARNMQAHQEKIERVRPKPQAEVVRKPGGYQVRY